MKEDIWKCSGIDCPLGDYCYRKNPDSDYKFSRPPYKLIKGNHVKCDHFISKNKKLEDGKYKRL